MFQPLISAAAVGAATVLAAPALAAAPAPDYRIEPDSVGDVWVRAADGSWSEAGPRVNADVTLTTVNHFPRRVRARLDYNRLEDGTSDTVRVDLRLRTSAGRTYVVRLTDAPTGPTRVALRRFTGTGSRTVPVTCRRLDGRVGWDGDLVVLSVPRPCIGRPAWVRYTGEAKAISSGPTATYSDALRSTDPVNDLYSPRIARG